MERLDVKTELENMKKGQPIKSLKQGIKYLRMCSPKKMINDGVVQYNLTHKREFFLQP